MTDYLTDANNDIKTYFKTHDIPTHFYQCFFGELIKVFGVKFIIPDEDYDAQYDYDGNVIGHYNEEYSYKDQITYTLCDLSGTGGWHKAFKAACDQCGMMDIYDDYDKMDWVRSDIFDGYIADRMIDVLFAEGRNNDYYRFKMQKEKTND